MASKSTAGWNAYRYPQGTHLVKVKNSHCDRSLIHCDCSRRAFPAQVTVKCCQWDIFWSQLKGSRDGKCRWASGRSTLKSEPNTVWNWAKTFGNFVTCTVPGKKIFWIIAGMRPRQWLNTYPDLSKTQRFLHLLLANHLAPGLKF